LYNRLCEFRNILIASGSEVALAVESQEKLVGEGIAARVVSMPSWDLFEKQPRSYRDEVLPPSVTARLAIRSRLAVRLGALRWAERSCNRA
jgi:transketolase